MKSFVFLALGFLAGGSLASAQDPAKLANIERILALTNAQATMDQVFAQMKSMMASQVPPGATAEQQARMQETTAKIMDLVKARMSWDRLRPQYVKVYDETFSAQEIDGILAFYQSPSGRAMLEKMPQLLSKTMAIAQSQMADIMPEIQSISKQPPPK